jgi:hypothetical protein
LLLLFLGAGFSKAAGLGDLGDLTSKVKSELKKKGYSNIYEKVEGRLTAANRRLQLFDRGEIDLEVILSILNADANQVNTLKSEPFAAYISTFTDITEWQSERVKLRDLNRIRMTVGRILTNNLLKYDKHIAKRYYQELCQIPIELNHKYRTKIGSDTQPPLLGDIVTTNYDRIIEDLYEYEDIHGRPPRIGFKEDTKTQERYLDTTGILDGSYFGTNRKIEYLKLHGSIDWRIRSSDKRIVQRESTKSFKGEKYPDQVMVYPAYEKYISEDPYFSLYYYFRYLLHINNVYIVIGFSFRDLSINNAFRDALLNKPASRMVIINSDDRIKKRACNIFPKNKIDFIKARFGEKIVPSEIKNVLS